MLNLVDSIYDDYLPIPTPTSIPTDESNATDDVTVVTSNCSRKPKSGCALQPPPGFKVRPPPGFPTIPQYAPLRQKNRVIPQQQQSQAVTKPQIIEGQSSRTVAWNKIVNAERAGSSENALFDVSGIKIAVNLAIADARVTSHFVLSGAPVSNIDKALKPLNIHLPNGDTIHSTHTCLLKRSDLPRAARLPHIDQVRGDRCKVTYKNKQIWTGVREPTTGLWVLHLTPDATRSPPTSETLRHEAANNVYQMTSKESLKFLVEEDIGLQLVGPHNHCVNAAKRAIQTFKNLFIVGASASVTPTSPRSCGAVSCDNARMQETCSERLVSAYHFLEGVRDFNKVPWVPPGTRATIFNPPKLRVSWGPRALDVWYVLPAWQHYRNWHFYVPSTGDIFTSGKTSSTRMPLLGPGP
ncbi:hypothetical protein ACHAWF_007102 [Thalassiosira exigua]